MTREQERFVERYLRELIAGDAAIFAGAGLSAAAGFVDWRELLRGLAVEIDLQIDLENDLVAVAQFHVNANRDNRNALNQAIIDALSPDNAPTTNHKVLAQLPITTWWTTNYDKLIEEALKTAGKVVDVKSDVDQLANTRPRRDAIVYKMHGDVDHPNQAVITRDDYERYERDRGAFTTALAGDLVSKTFLFIGFSFNDPNLAAVLSRVRITFRNNQRPHYAIFRTRKRLPGESDDAFVHAQAWQRHVVADLLRFNIHVVLVDEYAEIDAILAELARRYRQRTVFVSGSAADFSPWDETQVTEFMRALGDALVAGDMRLTTGLGYGIGNALFTGAVQRVLQTGGVHIEDIITARPFPQAVADPRQRDALWETFRRDLIGGAGIALFLFGNKNDGGGVTSAEGVRAEYELARELGLDVLPIGATGSMAETLAKEALGDPNLHLRNLDVDGRKQLTELASPVTDLMTLVRPIVRLVQHQRRRLPA